MLKQRCFLPTSWTCAVTTIPMITPKGLKRLKKVKYQNYASKEFKIIGKSSTIRILVEKERAKGQKPVWNNNGSRKGQTCNQCGNDKSLPVPWQANQFFKSADWPVTSSWLHDLTLTITWSVKDGLNVVSIWFQCGLNGSTMVSMFFFLPENSDIKDNAPLLYPWKDVVVTPISF